MITSTYRKNRNISPSHLNTCRQLSSTVCLNPRSIINSFICWNQFLGACLRPYRLFAVSNNNHFQCPCPVLISSRCLHLSQRIGTRYPHPVVVNVISTLWQRPPWVETLSPWPQEQKFPGCPVFLLFSPVILQFVHIAWSDQLYPTGILTISQHPRCLKLLAPHALIPFTVEILPRPCTPLVYMPLDLPPRRHSVHPPQ